MDSQYLMRGKCATSCFVYQSFSIRLVNRFNLIQTVGGKINWNCNGGHVGQDSVCFGAYHFQRANVAVYHRLDSDTIHKPECWIKVL